MQAGVFIGGFEQQKYPTPQDPCFRESIYRDKLSQTCAWSSLSSFGGWGGGHWASAVHEAWVTLLLHREAKECLAMAFLGQSTMWMPLPGQCRCLALIWGWTSTLSSIPAFFTSGNCFVPCPPSQGPTFQEANCSLNTWVLTKRLTVP